MTRGVVRGEVCRNEEDPGCRGEERGEACCRGCCCWWRGPLHECLPVLLPRRECFGSAVVVVRAPYYARVKQALVLEVHARGVDQFAKVLWSKITLAEGGGEAWPEGIAGALERRQGARCRLGQGVVYRDAEALPKVGCLCCSGVGEGLWQCGGKDPDEVCLGVVWKVNMGNMRSTETAWWGTGHDEDGGQGGDLGAFWSTTHGGGNEDEHATRVRLTISESLAKAGRSVGGASFWRSMASKTSTK